MVVHWIGTISEAELSKLLAQETLLAFDNLSAFSLSQPVLYLSALYPAVFATVFLREPTEKLTLADETRLEHFLVGLCQQWSPEADATPCCSGPDTSRELV